MNNFALLRSNINTEKIYNKLAEINCWNELDFRKRSMFSAHTQVDDIILRFDSIKNYTGGMDCIDYPAMDLFKPQITELLEIMQQETNTNKVGRCVITRLRPGKKVTKHIDTDVSVKVYKRYHICIQGNTGNLFFCGNESVEMLTGQCWWFNNQKTHWCVNSGSQDRIHLIADLA